VLGTLEQQFAGPLETAVAWLSSAARAQEQSYTFSTYEAK